MQGGVGDFTRELALALADLGHEVHVITRRTDERRTTNDERRIMHHPVIPNWGWRGVAQALTLARRLELDISNIQYQAAAYDLHPAINFAPFRMRFAPVVVTFHDLKTPYLFPKAGPLRGWVVTLLARRAAAAIVTNRADELTLAARGVRRVARIPIGSNIAPALPANFDRAAWRAQFGLSSEHFVLGFFGFFNARKGVETLIRALAILRQDESPIPNPPSSIYHLLFIGGAVGSSDATNRAYADRMTALIAELGLTDRVHYTGYVSPEKVSAAFAALDLCVLPYADGISFHHGTLMAALAHAQPIVSTRPAVELPELAHGENVWLTPPDDPGALAAAIAELAADPQRRRRLARGAAELAQEFTWECIAARTAQLFDELVR
jgi:glycosyltransferase involved in cell wall biosynthesis